MLAGLVVSLLRRLPSYAHMGAFRVVEADYALQDGLALLMCGYGHLVQPFALEDAVGAFGDCILERITALGHADAYAVFLEFGHIRVAAILTSAVGMVDETVSRPLVNRLQRHPESLQRVFRLQSRADGPANYLVGVGIRYKRKIAYALLRLYVCYVAHPYRVRPVGDNILYEVRIPPVVVVGVRGLVSSSPADMDHQPVLAEQLYESVASGHAPGLLEQRADDDVQLHAAETRIIFAVVPGFLHDEGFYGILREVVLLVLVE